MVFWMYCVVLSDKYDFDNEYVSKKMQNEYNIETRPFFIGLHEQPSIIKYLKQRNRNIIDSYPITEKVSKRGFYLPSGFNLTENEIIYICDSLKKILI